MIVATVGEQVSAQEFAGQYAFQPGAVALGRPAAVTAQQFREVLQSAPDFRHHAPVNDTALDRPRHQQTNLTRPCLQCATP